MATTEAWVIERGRGDPRQRAELSLQSFPVSEPGPSEVLVEPLYGCWEGNMAHAVERRPIDICAFRDEDRVVLGNSGVVRAVSVGQDVVGIEAGQELMFISTGVTDEFGYMELAYAYDAPGTVGLLARRVVVPARNLFAIPSGSTATLEQWAAFSLRYLTAWSNWQVAYACFRTQLSVADVPSPHVWGWGGGSTLAELELARHHGCRSTMLSASDENLVRIRAAGVDAIDRRAFGDLDHDPVRYSSDPAYRSAYQDAERRFLSVVADRTAGRGVDIFVDYIGLPTMRATQKALGRLGVVTTAGWKHGMDTSTNRAIECIARHIHVHTHYVRLAEVGPAMAFAVANDWMPRVAPDDIYDFEQVSTLADDYAAGRTGYFPVYRINAS